MTSKQFIILMQQWKEGRLSRADSVDFFAAIQSGQFDELASEIFESHMDAGDLNNLIDGNEQEAVFRRLMEIRPVQHVKTIHRVHFLKTAWFRVAAAVLLITSIGAYLWLQPSTDKSEITQNKLVPEKNSVLPGGNKALLKLADGSTIILDSASNGLLAKQSGAEIQKSAGGQVVYAFNKSSVESDISFNTMSTPRGGQYQLILPDGSKLWLNAESSITFPTVFTENKREVKITGEIYFEVTRNKEKPFIVKTISDEIQVLGTSFNINAYPGTPVKTSLLEGSVRIDAMILKPGQAHRNSQVLPTNIAQDIAWKNGRFDFSGLDVKQAMQQIARWYDINVEYVGAVEEVKLEGKVKRNFSLSDLLSGLEGVGGLHFTTKGKTVTVSR